MSLLDGGGMYQPCNVYMEVHATDEDGNLVTRASTTPIPATAHFTIQNQSGTSSRLAESQGEGDSIEQIFLVKFPRSWVAANGTIQAQAKIGWGTDSLGREKLWSVFGDVIPHSGSRRTAHQVYTIRRT